MKRTVIFLWMCLWLSEAMAQQLVVGTYNIRLLNKRDSLKGEVWSRRSRALCDQVNWVQPDIFGTQEAYISQIHDMERMLDGYTHIGVAREDGKEKGEHSAIFYKPSRLRLLRNGDFWLSETPDRPGLGWDAACIRICSWGEFRDRRTHQRFFYFNLHMDHVGVVARREAARLVVKKIRELAGEHKRVILTGDFNVDQHNEIYQIFVQSGLLKDSYEAARLRFAENGTFNDFDGNAFTDSRIDHVFVSPRMDVLNYAVLTNSYWTESLQDVDGRKSGNAPQEITLRRYERHTPSDHYPVFVRIK